MRRFSVRLLALGLALGALGATAVLAASAYARTTQTNASQVAGPAGRASLSGQPATPGAGPNTLFFTDGLNHEADRLFGTIMPNG